ncbi:hypothetical protein DVS28_a4728 [Euzebya pacifica]|jgi:GABA permease|uniref:C2H2-type domain-containing protein n=1 Tax=Euzebya pacifica TaxID=1608957 RepID=A0A346Y4J2_9ACTN|nr:hypothetical protein [Euzebya pacifica]AXV09389.1 hypothetical protein DVS28_a4728 [Euzebya pacifica]
MTIHTCIRCPLRFTNRAELADHMAHDHRVPGEVLEVLAYPGAHEARPLYRQFASDDGVHRILLIANQTLGSESVMATMHARLRAHERVSVFVVVPATPSEHLASAPGAGRPAAAEAGLDARTDDAGLAQARFRLRRAVAMLTDVGIVAHGRIGDANPLRAAASVMTAEPIDEIVLCTLDHALSRWLRADVPTALRRQYDVPVTAIVVPPGAEEDAPTDDLAVNGTLAAEATGA